MLIMPCVVLAAQLCLTLCDPVGCSPPGYPVHGILQARILEWVVISSSRDLPDLGIKSRSPALAGRFFTTESPGKPKEYSRRVQTCSASKDTPLLLNLHQV